MKKKTTKKKKTANKNLVPQKEGNKYPPLALTNMWSKEAATEVIATLCASDNLVPYQIKCC